jgi:hypothetical protein
MRTFPSDVAFTTAVKAILQARGSREGYARMETGRGWRTTITAELADFLADLDMFYLGTANAEGRHYIQYRGGQPGFLKAIDKRTLGFADFGGSQQYVTLGNLSENPKAFHFLMDYANRRRIKMWEQLVWSKKTSPCWRNSTTQNNLATWSGPSCSRSKVGCELPQHIHRRVSERQVAPVIEKLQAWIAELEAEVARLQSGNNKPQGT